MKSMLSQPNDAPIKDVDMIICEAQNLHDAIAQSSVDESLSGEKQDALACVSVAIAELRDGLRWILQLNRARTGK